MSETTELELQPEPAPKARSTGRVVAALVAVVALVGGAVFAVAALSDDGNKPEDPVRAMFEAAQKSDVIGVLEQLAPGERDALRDPLTKLVDELNRLEVLKGADPRNVSGVEIEIEDLALKADEVSDDLAAVRITGGKGTFRSDLAKLPVGDFVLDLIGHPLRGKDTESDSLKSKKDEDTVTTIKRGGRWYVSIGYSVAEQVRRDRNVSLADLGDGVTPDGADSPEDAVRGMFEAGADLDLRKVIGLLPPDEMGALQDYAGLFLPEAERAIDDASKQFSAKIESLDVKADTSGDEALVTVKDIAFSADVGDFSAAYADGCLSFDDPSGEGGTKRFCKGDDPLEQLNQLSGGMFDGLDTEALKPPDLFHGKSPTVGIVVRKVDGKWYVDPIRTELDATIAVLHELDRADLDAIAKWVRGLGDMFTRFETESTSSSSALYGTAAGGN